MDREKIAVKLAAEVDEYNAVVDRITQLRSDLRALEGEQEQRVGRCAALTEILNDDQPNPSVPPPSLQGS